MIAGSWLTMVVGGCGIITQLICEKQNKRQ